MQLFNEKPIVETYEGTYADSSTDIVQDYVMWNHSLADVLQNLMEQGLNIKKFNWSPYPCFRHVEEFEKGKWRIPVFGNKIPMIFSVEAQKSHHH
jgi:hypothetical protein